MATHVALLRGINVGTRNRVGMPQLRELLEGLGYRRVRTHLQSGNAVFDTAQRPERVAGRIERALEAELGLRVPVQVRTADELAAVVAGDPLGDVADDPARYLVQFLASEPDYGRLDLPRPEAFAPERYVAKGREIYLWLPGGVHSAKLPPALNRLGLTGTARNWRTVVRLLELARE